MLNISGFFERFKQREFQEVLRRTVIVDIIEKHTQIKLNPTSIKFQQKKIIISASAVEKNQIFMKKMNILDDIFQKTKPTIFSDLG